MSITVTRLATPVYEGDWHDPALRWEVVSDRHPRQLFETRKNANTFARFLREGLTFNEAVTAYIREATR